MTWKCRLNNLDVTSCSIDVSLTLLQCRVPAGVASSPLCSNGMYDTSSKMLFVESGRMPLPLPEPRENVHGSLKVSLGTIFLRNKSQNNADRIKDGLE